MNYFFKNSSLEGSIYGIAAKTLLGALFLKVQLHLFFSCFFFIFSPWLAATWSPLLPCSDPPPPLGSEKNLCAAITRQKRAVETCWVKGMVMSFPLQRRVSGVVGLQPSGCSAFDANGSDARVLSSGMKIKCFSICHLDY